MSKKKKTNNEIIVRGIRLAGDSIYEVSNKKPNASAPELYKELGSEKISAPKGMVMNVVGFPFINGVWDTGLYPTSPIFREEGLTIEEAEIKAKANREFIIEPLLKAGLKNLVDKLEDFENENSEFFISEVMVPLFYGSQFNTGEPRSRLALYTAIISGELAPKGKATKEEREKGVRNEDDFLYTNAQYTITSQTENRTIREEREYNNNKARGIFWAMLENDKSGLIGIMNYEGISATDKDPDVALSQIISRYFESNENIDSFLETYEKYKTDKTFQEELRIIDILLNEKGLRYFEKEGRTYLLDGTDVGTSPKVVAKTIANNEKLKIRFYDKVEL